KIYWPGHVTIRAKHLFDVAAVTAQEKFNLHRVGGHDGVVIRFEGRLHDGRHALETDGVRPGADVAPFRPKQSPIAPFVGQAAHSRMITKAEHAQKVRAGNHHPAVHLSHTRQFAKKRLGLIHVFQDVERAYAGEIVVGIWQPFAVVELAAVAEFSGARDVRLGDIRAV